MELVTTKKYNTLKEFIDTISYNGELYKIFAHDYFFRGVPSYKYELVPSALRTTNMDRLWFLSCSEGDKHLNLEYSQRTTEYLILKRFYRGCDKNSLPLPNIDRFRDSLNDDIDISYIFCTGREWLPHDLYEIAALAQHYGLPTRLLDWSKSIFTALYFAAINYIHGNVKDNYIALWAFHPAIVTPIVPPLKIINPSYHGNPNLAAQQGIFTLWEMNNIIISNEPLRIDIKKEADRRPLNELIAEYLTKTNRNFNFENLFYKILIPANESLELLEYLSVLGYDSARLFPGYSGVVKNIVDQADRVQLYLHTRS